MICFMAAARAAEYSEIQVKAFEPFEIDLEHGMVRALVIWDDSEVNVSVESGEVFRGVTHPLWITGARAVLHFGLSVTVRVWRVRQTQCRDAAIVVTTPGYLNDSLVLSGGLGSVCFFPFPIGELEFRLEIKGKSDSGSSIVESHGNCESKIACDVRSTGPFFLEALNLEKGAVLAVTLLAEGAREGPCREVLAARINATRLDLFGMETLFERAVMSCEIADMPAQLQSFGFLFLGIVILSVAIFFLFRTRHKVFQLVNRCRKPGKMREVFNPESLLSNVAEPIDHDRRVADEKLTIV
jgi:hypothetical protein